MPPIPSLPSPRVCAVVVAFNRRDKLRACLKQLQAQTRALDAVLVVNNASTDGTGEMVRAEFPSVSLLDLAENTGGAGGFHAGMERAFGEGYDWLWLMDDDVLAAPDALEKMLEHAQDGEVLVPLQRDSAGRIYGVNVWAGRLIEVAPEIVAGKRPCIGSYAFAFAGPLVSKRVIEQVGLPRADFFIWFDDAEYSLRVHDARLPIRVVPSAILDHDVGGAPKPVRVLGKTLLRIVPPPWKLYYGTRNMLFVLLRQKTTRRARQRMLFQFLASQGYGAALDVCCEADRIVRLKRRLSGLRDGIRGHLGKRDWT